MDILWKVVCNKYFNLQEVMTQVTGSSDVDDDEEEEAEDDKSEAA